MKSLDVIKSLWNPCRHRMCRKINKLFFLATFLFIPGITSIMAQNTVTGTVNDVKGMPLPGVTVVIQGTSTGTITDLDGKYSIRVLPTESLLFSFVGYSSVEKLVGDNQKIDIVLEEDLIGIEEIAVVGFGTQKKTSMVSSISTVSSKELKISSSNLTTALAGKISGMISYQRSGEPGEDNAEFFIRGLGTFGSGKVDPLILIDGIESSANDMARLQPDDIATFSVLKDATAAAVYGARGANGVVLITTKSGKAGRTKFEFRAENRISTNTQKIQLADNVTYMNLANEASLTRFPLSPTPYSLIKIQHTERGTDPILYPDNNWLDDLIKDYTMNQAYNFSVSGGSEKARYYVAGTYNVDNGILKIDPINDFNNNISLKNYSIRSNVNIKLTKTTEGIIRMYGQFDDYNGPIGGGRQTFRNALFTNPVSFPAVYPSEFLPYIDHPLFGGSAQSQNSNVIYTNPYAEMVKGFEIYKTSNMQPQFEIKQDLNMLLPGLSARAMAYVKRHSYFKMPRQYSPFYYQAAINPADGSTMLRVLNDGGEYSIGTTGSEALSYDSGKGEKKVSSQTYFESALNYNYTFNEKHDVTGMLILLLSEYQSGNENSLQASLKERNFGLSGRFTYAYDTRYLAEINFGYNGSEKFAKKQRWGLFPSVGIGYLVSNEDFFKGLTRVVSSLKLRASYGFIGNDEISKKEDRFFYLSEINLSNGDYSSTFGEDWDYKRNGVTINRYENPNITWERSEQINLGMDFQLFHSFDFIVDVYKQHRTNILQDRSFIGSTMGIAAIPKSNFGEVISKGIDLSANFNKSYNSGLYAILRGNFTFATNEYAVYDEVPYPEKEYYRTKIGQPVKQKFGYIAERLFVDDYEVINSPNQFGFYRGGDIKYRDMNDDGSITEADMVPIGYPTTPEIVYGFGGTFGYKNFDLSLYFQGNARTSIFIDPKKISPFVLSEGLEVESNVKLPAGAQTGLLEVIADDHWSEENRDSYAFWPRLSDYWIENNNQTSTWWMRNGSFLRLKSVEAGYNLPNQLLAKFRIDDLRIYLTATNLAVWSPFKLWDPEMGSSGLGYPIQAVYSIGTRVSF